VDRHHVAVAALKALADEGKIAPAIVAEAIAKYELDAGSPAPWTI
jgi:pyruvate dehydrogenase E1 component